MGEPAIAFEEATQRLEQACAPKEESELRDFIEAFGLLGKIDLTVVGMPEEHLQRCLVAVDRILQVLNFLSGSATEGARRHSPELHREMEAAVRRASAGLAVQRAKIAFMLDPAALEGEPAEVVDAAKAALTQLAELSTDALSDEERSLLGEPAKDPGKLDAWLD